MSLDFLNDPALGLKPGQVTSIVRRAPAVLAHPERVQASHATVRALFDGLGAKDTALGPLFRECPKVLLVPAPELRATSAALGAVGADQVRIYT